MPKSQSLEAEYAKKEQQIYEEFDKLKIKDKQTYEKVEAKRVKAIHKKLSVLEKKRERRLKTWNRLTVKFMASNVSSFLVETLCADFARKRSISVLLLWFAVKSVFHNHSLS